MPGIVKIMCSPGPLTSISRALLGPSGALSYAVGIVPHIRQLQEEHRGFHLETSVSTQQVSTRDRSFHCQAGSRSHPLRLGPTRRWQQQVRATQNGAS